MPTYDFECTKCGKRWEQVLPMAQRNNSKRCECGGGGKRIYSLGSRVEVFKPMWYDDLAETPIYIDSKRQLREECKRRNLIAARLL